MQHIPCREERQNCRMLRLLKRKQIGWQPQNLFHVAIDTSKKVIAKVVGNVKNNFASVVDKGEKNFTRVAEKFLFGQ